MENSKSRSNATRIALFCVVFAALVVGMTQWSSVKVSANHPVLVEGNCDSPVPGTTLVAPGTCGDFDGDGRIGTAEDTDGADRIFGTLRAALGPGTGAAAGTGANQNGKMIIVASGRFAENLFIGNTGIVVGEGVAVPGNMTIEAAPGVDADIDAILQGDPAGGNNTRTTQTGIQVTYITANTGVVTLRNLEIRNWFIGVSTSLNSKVHIDNCRLEGNLAHGMRIIDSSRVSITNSQIVGSGFRTGVGSATPSPGNGIAVEGTALVRIAFTNISHSFAAGIINTTGAAANVGLYGVTTYFNNPNLAGSGAISATDPNYAQ